MADKPISTATQQQPPPMFRFWKTLHLSPILHVPTVFSPYAAPRKYMYYNMSSIPTPRMRWGNTQRKILEDYIRNVFVLSCQINKTIFILLFHYHQVGYLGGGASEAWATIFGTTKTSAIFDKFTIKVCHILSQEKMSSEKSVTFCSPW